MTAEAGPEAVRRLVAGSKPYRRANGSGDDPRPEPPPIDDDAPRRAFTWAVPPPATADEWTKARLAPRCIVEDYLFADVATLIAPGSTGKTTATLYEAACIVLGLPLWGLRVVTPGPVLIVTAEDRSEYLHARLREICAAMRLSAAQTERVRELVRIDDRTTTTRRLTAIVADVVTGSGFAEAMVAGCRRDKFAPVLAQFDPMVSFGVGEARVNDAEQGLIDAARVITSGLDCAVRYVHHSGKANAREKAVDQYAGRNGSALPDGCRMVAVMHPCDSGEIAKATGRGLIEGESAFVLHRPKVSHAPPQGDKPLYVIRRGYGFEHVPTLSAAGREAVEAEAQRAREVEIRGALLDAAEAAQRDGAPLSASTLVDRVRGFKTDDKRSALAQLLAEGWLVEGSVPARWRLVNNRRRTWIVRLDAAERDAFRAAGELPEAATRPPASIATPPAGGAE